MSAYRAALLDWLACACGGREQRAAVSARAAGDGLLDDAGAPAQRLLDALA
jgi:hypothetical protein